MFSPEALAMITLTGSALGAAGALAVVPTDRHTPGPSAAAVASSFPVIVGALFGVFAYVGFLTLDLYDQYGWRMLPLILFGVLYAASMQWRWQIEPKLWSVIRRRATMQEYIKAHARPWLLTTGSRFAATWVTAVLVVGWVSVLDYGSAAVRRVLNLVGA